MTPIALFIAPLMPLMELLLMANMRPLKSGRAFQRFWKALAWVATSLILDRRTGRTCDIHNFGGCYMCVCVCAYMCVCVYIYSIIR